MQMIDVLKRLAELDEKNPNIVKQGVAEGTNQSVMANQVKDLLNHKEYDKAYSVATELDDKFPIDEFWQYMNAAKKAQNPTPHERAAYSMLNVFIKNAQQGVAEGSRKTYQPKHVAWVVNHGNGKVSEFKPHEDDAARSKYDSVKHNRGSSIYAIDQHSQSIPMGSLKALRKKQGVAEGADVEYIVVIRDEQGKRSIRVSALTPTDAKEKAEAQGYKVLKVKDPQEKHYFKEQGVAAGSEDLVQIEYWQQETMESGRWVKTKPIPRATAEKIVNSFERGEIVDVEKGVAEGADVEYIVVIRDEQGKRSIRVSALTPTDAKEKAEAQGYKVLKVKDPQEKHYFKEQGVAEGLEECGMIGSGMSQPHSPASINMTAATGEELSSMLKDIMQLAGMKQVGADDLGHDHEPAVISATPSISIAKLDDEPSDMKSMISKIDSMNEPTEEEYDNTPNDPTDTNEFDAEQHAHHENPPGADRKGNANNPRAYDTNESVTSKLMSEYQKFINEN